jgi:hypothetical protein
MLPIVIMGRTSMIKPEDIPPEVVIAAREAWLLSDLGAAEDWRAGIAAALNAWPGMQVEGGLILDKTFHDIILPLPQEKRE